MKGVVLLRREISLKIICEKVNFQTVSFAIIFVTMNGHIYKLSKRIYFVMFKPREKGRSTIFISSLPSIRKSLNVFE